MEQNFIPGYVQVVSSNFDGSFVDSIAREAVEAYKGQMRRFPIERERTLVMNQEKGTLEMVSQIAGETKKIAGFCCGYVESVMEVEYSPQLWFQNIYLVDIVIEKKASGVIIPCSSWGKKEMLRIFQRNGLVFTIDKKEGEILAIFNNYLSMFLRQNEKVKFDSRAGWFKGESWTYRTADTWPMPEIPSVVREKTLGVKGHISVNEIAEVVRWLKGIRREPLRLLLLAILYTGMAFSRILKVAKLVQGKYIIFSYESERVRFFLEEYFSFFVEDSARRISLSMPTKELVRILKSCKDQIVVIDADSGDVSGRKKQNLAILSQFVRSGNLPDGGLAESLVVLITNGIPGGISFDNAVVFAIHDEDFEDAFLETESIRSRSAKLVAFFAEDIQRKQAWFENCFSRVEVSSSIGSILRSAGSAIMELFEKLQLFGNPKKTQEQFNFQLEAAEEFSDVVGIGGIVSEVLISKIRNGELYLKKANQAVEKEELGYAVLFDKSVFFLGDVLIKKVILPEIASEDITVIVLRKYLAAEGFLLQYESESGEKSYKKKKLLRNKIGIRYSTWMTAILQKRVEEALDIEIEELLEDICNE